MERLTYARIEPIVDSRLPQKQAEFRRGRSTTDQVTLLSQGIKNSFSAKKKAGAAFVDLTAAYDTVCHRGFTSKLLRTLPDSTNSLSTCPIYVGFWPTFIWACCCGLDVIVTFLNYDIKNLIVMQKTHSNKPT